MPRGTPIAATTFNAATAASFNPRNRFASKLRYKGPLPPNPIASIVEIDLQGNRAPKAKLREIRLLQSSKSICKEIALQRPNSGKFDYLNPRNRFARKSRSKG